MLLVVAFFSAAIAAAAVPVTSGSWRARFTSETSQGRHCRSRPTTKKLARTAAENSSLASLILSGLAKDYAAQNA